MTTRKPLVYLAGSIEQLSPEEAGDWRAVAAGHLRRIGINSFDPYREHNQVNILERMEWVWHENMKQIRMADVFLCVLHPAARSIGSIRELQIAISSEKDVLVVDEHLFYNPNPSAWDIPVFKNLEEAIWDIETRWANVEIDADGNI